MSEYRPIPVDVARQIADAFAKGAVVILAWDQQHALIHTTTYGTDPALKIAAAKLGDICTKAAGFDLNRRQVTEDFRDVTAAEWAVERAALRREIEQLKASKGA